MDHPLASANVGRKRRARILAGSVGRTARLTLKLDEGQQEVLSVVARVWWATIRSAVALEG